MTEIVNKKGLFPLSIVGYSLLFLTIIIISFSLLTWLTYSRLGALQAELQQVNMSHASKELQQAKENIQHELISLRTTLSDWDELRQQVVHPQYYAYWRRHRLMAARVIPDFVLTAEIYNRHGHALAVPKTEIFPQQVEPQYFEPTVRFISGRAYLFALIPFSINTNIPQQGYSGVASAYALIQIPLLEFLANREGVYRLVDPLSFSLKTVNKHEVTLDKAINTVSYILHSYDGTTEILSIIDAALRQFAVLLLLLCFIFYLLIRFFLNQPLIELSSYIDALKNTRGKYLMPKFSSSLLVSEFEKVRTSLNDYQLALEQVSSTLDEKNQELWDLAHHDSLTNIKNRRAFDTAWQRSKKVLHDRRLDIALLIFDINHFKAINDTYGHSIGDDVLIAISQNVQSALRKGESLFRIGGDEFAAILVGSDETTAIAIGQRCLEHINSHDYSTIGLKEPVRVSVGISCCCAENPSKLEQLQWQADIAVYRAKRPGINHPVLFTDDMADGSEAMFSSWISQAVFDAVNDHTLLNMHYQAITRLDTKEVAYYEALIRIENTNGQIPPSSIFAVTAQHLLETEMDKSVIKAVVHDIKNNIIPAGAGVSINLSAPSLIDKNLPVWLSELTPHIKNRKIVIEVTETALITQLIEATKNLEILQNNGFKIALDDFGSGYSSIRYLTTMPVDIIKFDLSLIQTLENKKHRQIVEHLAKLFRKLGYSLVAEGIETEAQLQRVIECGFDTAQGYLFSTPERDKLQHESTDQSSHL